MTHTHDALDCAINELQAATEGLLRPHDDPTRPNSATIVEMQAASDRFDRATENYRLRTI